MEEQKKYTLTFFEVTEKLGLSRKTISRYVRKGTLNPIKIQSKYRTPEYRFNEEEVLRLRSGIRTGQDEIIETIGQGNQQDEGLYNIDNIRHQDRTPFEDRLRQESPTVIQHTDKTEKKYETGKEQSGQDKPGQSETAGILAFLEKTLSTITKQLEAKDKQIEGLEMRAKEDREIMHSLIERNREMNVLIKFLQDKYPALEAPKQRRGRKAKGHAIEAEPIDITESQAETRTADQEPQEAPEPPKKKKKPARRARLGY